MFPWPLLGIFLYSGPGPAEKTAEPSRFAVIQNAPDFALTAQTGDRLRREDLKNKIYLVSFIFTTCNGTCPVTTHRMVQIQEALKSAGLWKEGTIRLLSITVDPTRDTPEKLRDYMRLYDADPARWTFLTGSRADIAKTIEAWGMWARPGLDGQIDHPSRIFLVDGRSRIREIYNLSFFKPAWVLDDIQFLLKESKE
jgi:protein SCO1/2